SPASRRRRAAPGSPRTENRRRYFGFERRRVRLRRFELGGLFLDQLDQVIDNVGILEPVVGHAADIDLMRVVAAAGKADIGLARFAWPIDDAADHRQRQRRRDMSEPLLEYLDRLDDLK